jgi:hypothetical protein
LRKRDLHLGVGTWGGLAFDSASIFVSSRISWDKKEADHVSKPQKLS